LAPVNLNDLVEELGLLVRHKLANQGIKFIRDLYPMLPLVLGDAPQLEQAFLNLILNAAESMPKGGALTIRSKVSNNRDNSQHVVIEFKDTGEGMAEEQRKRAFRAVFATTKVKGSGLGLAIVGRIIETHQGQITILSRIGRGTTIRVKMPVIAEH
jgi:signal transduction histidine kinase